ncbi:hypothetical protein AALB51_15135 [Lachnospiraceae bacterium 62-26]
MFGKKRNKDEVKSGKPKTGQPSAKDGKPKTSQPAVKGSKPKAGQSAVKGSKPKAGQSAVKGSKPKTGQPAVKQKTQQEMSDKVLAKLMEIEKEARLEQARDSVDGLEDEKIAEHIELLLKIMQSRE